MSAFDSDLERNINDLVLVARSLRTRREREAAASALFRLISARRQMAIARADLDCTRGGHRAHGRPELNPMRISQEAPRWEAMERSHSRRRSLEAAIRSNGRRAA